jgi:hypothetical protein
VVTTQTPHTGHINSLCGWSMWNGGLSELEIPVCTSLPLAALPVQPWGHLRGQWGLVQVQTVQAHIHPPVQGSQAREDRLRKSPGRVWDFVTCRPTGEISRDSVQSSCWGLSHHTGAFAWNIMKPQVGRGDRCPAGPHCWAVLPHSLAPALLSSFLLTRTRCLVLFVGFAPPAPEKRYRGAGTSHRCCPPCLGRHRLMHP